MRCPECHAEYNVEEDMYCRHCGADLAVVSTSVVPTQASLPALLYNSPVPRSVAAGVGALALGVGIEILRRNMIARLQPVRSRSALPALSGVKDLLFPQNEKSLKLPRGYEIHETVVYMSRVIRRED